jgi:hypothetical protein
VFFRPLARILHGLVDPRVAFRFGICGLRTGADGAGHHLGPGLRPDPARGIDSLHRRLGVR